MTVKDLKKFIKDLPDDTVVLVDMGGQGVEDASPATLTNVIQHIFKNKKFEPITHPEALVF